MPNWSRRDTTKATPHKKGDIDFKHNIYGLVGSNLFKAFEEGKLTKRQLDNMLKQISIEAKVDLGKGYGVDLGYNPSGGERDDYRVKITKDIF
jgi:hypothetical protein